MSFGRRTDEKSHPVFRYLDSELGASIVVVVVLVALILIPRAAAH
jgi:hypothetical protein